MVNVVDVDERKDYSNSCPLVGWWHKFCYSAPAFEICTPGFKITPLACMQKQTNSAPSFENLPLKF